MAESFENRRFDRTVPGRVSFGYLLHKPRGFDGGKPYPLLIYLHGAGSRGDRLDRLSRTGPLAMIEGGLEFPMVTVAPQCNADTWFDLLGGVLEFIGCWRRQPFIDENRVILSGVSMGGYACWQIAMMRPEWFAAIVPVCGGGMDWNAGRLAGVPVWAFHGERDPVVSADESRRMVDAVNRSGGSARLTLFPGVGHDSWTPAFQDRRLYEWMLKQQKAP